MDQEAEQKSKFIQKKITLLYKEIQSIKEIALSAQGNPQAFTSFRGRFRELEKIHNEFTKYWDELYMLYLSHDMEKDLPIAEKYSINARTFVYECNSIYESVMNPIPSSVDPKTLETTSHNVTDPLNISTASAARARLPKINIPTFGGFLLDWPQWRDLFEALVHSEPSLTPIEKFQYLIGTLSGEPLHLVSVFPISANNYTSAWKALNDRYNNKRILASAYLQRIRQFKMSSPSTASAFHLRSFLKVVSESFSALKALDIPDEADYLKLQLALDCLDSDTRKLFEEKQQGQEFPKYDSLIEFIQQRCQILELVDIQSSSRQSQSRMSNNNFKQMKGVSGFTNEGPNSNSSSGSRSPRPSKRYSCPKCKDDHPLFKCNTFKSLPHDQRLSLVKSQRLCFNCLRSGHSAIKCSSKRSCIQCNKRHHSTLHGPSCNEVKDVSAPPPIANGLDTNTSPSVVAAAAGGRLVLLGTALVHIRDWKGDWQPVRMVIDTGSQFSFITMACARRLGLTWSPSKYMMSGIGETPLPQAKGVVSCKISPLNNKSTTIACKALVMQALTSSQPVVNISPDLKQHFDSIGLADEQFWESRPVEFLLGAELICEILLDAPRIKVTPQFGTLPTIFGHVVIGTPPTSSFLTEATCLATTEHVVSDSLLRSFWEIEEVQERDYDYSADRIFRDHFDNKIKRLDSGRYMVSLPLINPELTYPESQTLALSRFFKLEMKMNKDPFLKQQYCEFMRDYLQLGHMKPTKSPPKYVIPHHAVFKKGIGSNSPPKIRVVFDASMKTNNGALNDNLLPGPKLQNDITAVLMNFRTHRIAFCTDIVKMFRQILVVPEHTSYQCIYWRFSQGEPIQLYELLTVTQGESCSSFLAIGTIKKLIEDEGQAFPLAAKVLDRDMYVDDVVSGAENLEEVIELKSQLVDLLSKGCFSVHKWTSNSMEFLDMIQEEAREDHISFQDDDDITSKVLGMHWAAKSDCFGYRLESNALKAGPISKRTMLSIIARLYDPLGFLAPIILQGKFMIQQLWTLKIGWDQPLPNKVARAWEIFINDLPFVKDISIPRWLRCQGCALKLLGFCDASEKSYAAVLYLWVKQPDDSIHTFLLTAKTKLAPIKTISIPRLELHAAHLLIKLLLSVNHFCESHNIKEVWLFSDSTIVLSWLRISPQQLKTFVANRVSFIVSNTNINQWRHVPSNQNPADIASRGSLAKELVTKDLWWKGPEWMRIDPIQLPDMPHVIENVPERKNVQVLMTLNNDDFISTYIEKFSDFRKTVAVLAYVFRFVNACRLKAQSSACSIALTAQDIQNATQFLIANVQRDKLVKDYDFNLKVCKSAKFKALMIFQDKEGILRVGGRLGRSTLPYDTKHPIILPRDSKLTKLIIDYHHVKNFHLGAKALQAHIQRMFYIFGIKSLIRKQIWSCIRCFKLRARPNNPLMADLPLSRVSQGRPFISVGVDFAGPYLIKQSQRRNAATTKAYMCIFVCMAVKAVHLELVSSLSTDAFLAAFNRFIARRGLPSDVYSDCGTNFIGAARHLRELYEWHNKQSTQVGIVSHTCHTGVKWHFNPPSAPHFGGLWEAAVKSAKAHIRRTLGERPFYFEELATIFANVEAVLNSRPLGAVSANPTDFDYLTPGHFLIGGPLIAPPEVDHSNINMSHLKRWQLLQSAMQHFWRRWTNEYIHLLQERKLWTKQTPSIKIDDLVLIQDHTTSPLKWRVGRITAVYPDEKGVVRVVSLRTPSGDLKRPVHCIVSLDPLNCEGKTDRF